MANIIHPKLSYTVQGIFVTVYNTHGPLLREEIYENLIAHLIQQAGHPCQQQEEFHVLYKGVHIGTFRTDISLLPQLIIDVKVAQRIEPLHIAQMITYLKVTAADLGIVVNLRGPSLEFKRVPNFISHKFFGVPDDEAIEALLTASAEDQHAVTDQLGHQVRRAKAGPVALSLAPGCR